MGKKKTDEEDFFDPFPEPVVLPIEDVLDLHTFSPREVEPLLHDYLEACREQGIFQVKIIHGKGTGQLKDRVRRILAKHPHVLAVADADPQAGGWGATTVVLKQQENGYD
ncbi:MAG: Smr/MutS family protein [Deltaproteobacteria bacterium]|nr:Smr/MutS family protein [Deltaproteobacteria bacterium]